VPDPHLDETVDHIPTILSSYGMSMAAIPERVFTPSHPLRDYSVNDLIVPGIPFSHLLIIEGRRSAIDESTVVVCVDGACSGNGTPAARAGMGVYFGPDSPLNISEPLRGVQANQRAEICATIHAIKKIIASVPVRWFSRVVVVSDSAYVVQGMTDWVVEWRRNGYRSDRGGLLVNASDMAELDSTIKELEGSGTIVEFWQVRREDNRMADALARRGI
jgi:ribonuclease HI